MRALKMHGGGPPVVAGKPLDLAYREENLDLLAKGVVNLERHIRNTRKFGVPVVVAINQFASDTPAELELLRKAALDAGARTCFLAPLPSAPPLLCSRLSFLT